MTLSSRVRSRLARIRDRRAASAPVRPDTAALPAAPTALTASAPQFDATGATVPDATGATVPEPGAEVATTTSPEFDRAVPRGLQIAASWSWRVILVVVVLWGLGWVSRYLSEVVIPLGVAILLAAMLAPVANRLHGWGLPRGAATAITLLGGIALIAGALTLIGTQIASQSAELSTSVVGGFNQLAGWLSSGPLHLNTASWLDPSRWTERITAFIRDSSGEITTYAAEIGTQVGHFVAGFAITVFALFYFLFEGRTIFTFMLKFVPQTARERVDGAARKGWNSLSHYVRATILVALSDAVGVLIVALILGVPVAPALAALVFIGAFVPLVGAFVSGFAAVLVALVALGWVKALIMLAGIVLVMQVEGHILQPFLLGRAVKLHPLAVLLAIATGIVVGGIVGALMAVPLLAFSKAFIQYLANQADPPMAKLAWAPGRHRD